MLWMKELIRERREKLISQLQRKTLTAHLFEIKRKKKGEKLANKFYVV